MPGFIEGNRQGSPQSTSSNYRYGKPLTSATGSWLWLSFWMSFRCQRRALFAYEFEASGLRTLARV